MIRWCLNGLTGPERSVVGGLALKADDPIQRLLEPSAEPWPEPGASPIPCVTGTRRTFIDVEWLQEQMKIPAGKKRISPRQPAARFEAGADFLRFDWDTGKGGQTLIRHPGLGCLYLNHGDRAFLRLSPEQMIREPDDFETRQPSFELDEQEQENGELLVRITYHEPIELVWEGTFVPDKTLLPFAERLLDIIFGDGKIPLSTRKLIGRYTATRVLVRMQSWLMTKAGRRSTRISDISLDDLKLADTPAGRFGLPAGFRDLRPASQDPKPSGKWHPVDVGSKRAGARLATPGQFLPTFPKPDFELVLQECQESTLRVTSAIELRRMLTEHIAHLVNMATKRLDGFEGTRNAGGTDVTLVVDWLDQLRTFHEDNNENDGLFCFLMNPDPQRPGMLLRFAETLARGLVSDAEELPLGGEDDPVSLPNEVEDEIAAILESELEGEDRWNALTPTAQAAIRDGVLAQRLGRFEETFEGDSGPRRWPDSSGDLFRYNLQLESVALRFNRESLLQQLSIAADPDGSDPRIDLVANIPEFNIDFRLEWGPGVNLGILIGTVVVAAAVIAPVALPASILFLVGLGPIGWGILLAAIAGLPALIPGAALAITVLTLLLWNATRLRVGITGATLTTNIHPDIAGGPSAAALDSDSVSLTGEVTVAFDSEIPTGVHQLVEDMVEFAINTFDLARETVQEAVKDFLEETLRNIPHARSPLRFRRTTPVPVDVPGGSILDDKPVLAHELIGFAKDGETDRRVAWATAARSIFTPAEHGAYFTQVDVDLRPHLRQFLEEVAQVDEEVYGGYALSQNLLNSWAHGQWLARRLENGLRSASLADAASIVAEFCRDCACAEELEGHVWAASSPRILVQHELFIEHPDHFYLDAIFSDLRLCLSCPEREPGGSLEIQFSARSFAQVGFGTGGSLGRLSLASRGAHFADVYYETSADLYSLVPGRLGLSATGVFEGLQRLEPAQRLAFLRAMQPVLHDAAERVLRRSSANMIGREPRETRRDLQLYDGLIRARISVHRAGVYVAFAPFGQIRAILPDASGNIVLDIDNADCATGTSVLPPV